MPDLSPQRPESSDASLAEHVCMRCGACCALHVSFHRRELDRFGGTVPGDLTASWGAPEHVEMRRTGGAEPRCVALEGVIGEGTRCGTYARRPSPCRAFEPSWSEGRPNPWCDGARADHGLAPLTEADWKNSLTR